MAFFVSGIFQSLKVNACGNSILFTPFGIHENKWIKKGKQKTPEH
jgi:hypothetical protein